MGKQRGKKSSAPDLTVSGVTEPQLASIAPTPPPSAQPPDPQEFAAQQLVLAAIDKFIELRRSEWGQIPGQTGEFNPTIARYDMLQKFRKAVSQGDLSVSPGTVADFGEKLFEVWRSLCQQSVSGDHIWGHPIPLQQIYSRLPFMPWEEFLTALSTANHAALELVPSRVRNWSVNGRQVGAITFHQESPGETAT